MRSATIAENNVADGPNAVALTLRFDTNTLSGAIVRVGIAAVATIIGGGWERGVRVQ